MHETHGQHTHAPPIHDRMSDVSKQIITLTTIQRIIEQESETQNHLMGVPHRLLEEVRGMTLERACLCAWAASCEPRLIPYIMDSLDTLLGPHSLYLSRFWKHVVKLPRSVWATIQAPTHASDPIQRRLMDRREAYLLNISDPKEREFADRAADVTLIITENVLKRKLDRIRRPADQTAWRQAINYAPRASACAAIEIYLLASGKKLDSSMTLLTIFQYHRDITPK